MCDPFASDATPYSPALCRKAGVPRGDARGRITIHRARSTMASELYNACSGTSTAGSDGRARPAAYTQITPTRLAQAYVEAGDFTQNPPDDRGAHRPGGGPYPSWIGLPARKAHA